MKQVILAIVAFAAVGLALPTPAPILDMGKRDPAGFYGPPPTPPPTQPPPGCPHAGGMGKRDPAGFYGPPPTPPPTQPPPGGCPHGEMDKPVEQE